MINNEVLSNGEVFCKNFTILDVIYYPFTKAIFPLSFRGKRSLTFDEYHDLLSRHQIY